MRDRLHLVIQFVDQRHTRWDVEFGDLGLADVVEIFDKGADAVAVRGDEHALSRPDGGDERRVPVGQDAFQRDLERLGGGQLFGSQRGVTRIEARVAFVGRFQRGRRGVVTAPPDLHLRLAKLFGGLGFVQSLQRAVVTLVQLPGARDGNPLLVEFLENDPQGFNGAAQDGGVGRVENVAALAQELPRAVGFRHTLFGETDVGPAGEAVFQVPGALAVTEQDEFIHD